MHRSYGYRPEKKEIEKIELLEVIKDFGITLTPEQEIQLNQAVDKEFVLRSNYNTRNQKVNLEGEMKRLKSWNRMTRVLKDIENLISKRKVTIILWQSSAICCAKHKRLIYDHSQ